MNQNNKNSNWKKILGFRNMQEKLESVAYMKINLIGKSDYRGTRPYKFENLICENFCTLR